ncbi:MAG: 50S ribosomal protein L13 [Candidatus Marinamargulisbacteria bacterium]
MKKKQIKSFYPKKDSLNESWFIYDAKDQVLGRAATDISSLVLGKYMATYTPGALSRQHVVVINAEKIKVTGRKLTDKKYYRHSGYPGGLKETSLEHLMVRKPTEALRKAVNGMLPHNSYGRSLQTNVIYYAGESHKHEAQQPILFKKG